MWKDVGIVSFERYGRQKDVKTTLCAYWVWKGVGLLKNIKTFYRSIIKRIVRRMELRI